MKKYKTDSEDPQYKILTSGDLAIDPAAIVPSSEAGFLDTWQQTRGDYPVYPTPDNQNDFPKAVGTSDIDREDIPDTGNVFNFSGLNSDLTKKELYNDPISFSTPYIHYEPYGTKVKGKKKLIGIYINYLAEYKVADFRPNNYQSYIDDLNNRYK